MIIKKIAIGFLVILVAIPVLFHLVFVIAKLYYVCVAAHAVYPHDYPNSEWISEDGMVHLKVDEQSQVYGTVSKENNTFGIIVHISPAGGRVVANMYPNDYRRVYQTWKIKSFKDDKFVIKVYQEDEEVTIFEDGATITFYRVDTPTQIE